MEKDTRGWTPERRAAISKALKGNQNGAGPRAPRTDAHRAALSQSLKGRSKYRPSTAETYFATHWRINKELPGVCANCGSTRRLQASLRRGVPEERLLIATESRVAGIKYSLLASDYMHLCQQCHVVYDHPNWRHPCECTAVRLDDHVKNWAHQFSSQELDAIQQAEKALRRVAVDLSIWPERGVEYGNTKG